MWPIIHADQSTMDWREATYDCDVLVGDGRAEAHHKLEHARELHELVWSQMAVWTLEVRCPKTLYSQTFTSDDPSTPTVAHWEQEDMEGMIFLIPGLAATQDLNLPTAGLNDLWRTQDQILIPQGTWLAKGGPVITNSIDSLIRFRRDEKLKAGRMEVRDDTSSGSPRFIVSVSSDLFDRVSRAGSEARDVWVAALIGAFARIPELDAFRADHESSVSRMLKIKLYQAGVPNWDEEGWDPTLAATSIEPFQAVSLESSKND